GCAARCILELDVSHEGLHPPESPAHRPNAFRAASVSRTQRPGLRLSDMRAWLFYAMITAAATAAAAAPDSGRASRRANSTGGPPEARGAVGPQVVALP